MPPKSSFLCGCRALGCDVFCMVLVVRGCTYQQPARVPACPVVPILNTCQQKLSSPTCFKHQTCNYLFTPKIQSQLPLSSIFSFDNLDNGRRFGGASGSQCPSGPDDVLRARGQKGGCAQVQQPCAASLGSGMSNGCKAQQRPDTAAGDRGHS